MSSGEECEVEFEYDMEGDASSMSFESDPSPDDIFDTNEPIDTPNSRVYTDSTNTGYNGTLYKTWTLEKFVENTSLQALKKLENVQLGGCSEDDLLIMLQVKKWQSDQVLDAYFEDKERFLKQCGLPTTGRSNNKFRVATDFSCFICCEDYSSTQVYSTTCGHEYCIECYCHYISSEVSNGRLITCMEPSCTFTIPHKDVAKIASWKNNSNSNLNLNLNLSSNSNSSLNLISRNLVTTERCNLKENPLIIANARQIVNSKNVYKWCPATDCRSFTELITANSLLSFNNSSNSNSTSITSSSNINRDDISLVPIVGCAEQHEFCFQCNYENHLPCPCWIVKKWIKKCADDSETANWIDANTHSCPKCHTSIEKNGGCNHMTCRKCHNEFCWICLGDWASHSNNYSCNRYKDERAEDERRKNKSRATLERYLHFYKRYSIHESSMNGDQKTLKKIDDVTKLYMEDRRTRGEHNLSWNDIQFLPDAMRALQNGRKTLKWTYCFAFYLHKSNFAEIFETNQDFLNKTVEDLSEVFEEIIAIDKAHEVGRILERKFKIIALGELVKSRRRTLIKSAEENLVGKLLKFDDDI
ncbi:uncharacterized protein LODBEIA_P13040 [Lodderomyces beijingensis]|uniref:RBR-type E3 ubiquitin transferase n=1 Tax=Lodderomyces beijingensis TaxID=1775926 RepID=A0ABP0ZLC8_9ASCO